MLCTGADIIRRKLVGNNSESPDRSSRTPTRNKILLSRQEKRALRSLRLMEKVESIGLENIMHASSNYHHPVSISPLAVGSVRTRTASPMTQLTSLKNISQQQRRNDDPYAVDKETIKAVLNKGLSHESLLSDITTDGSTTSSITHLHESSDSTLNSQKSTSQASPHENNVTTNRSDKTPQKVKLMQRQKSRRSLINGGSGQRTDLGTVGTGATNKISNNNNHSKSTKSTKLTQELDSDDDDRSSVATSVTPQQSYTQSFVGSISSLFFGRKGGLL